MSIQEHLNKIRNAVYGHEVRESIAKGIETAYDDASEKDNANMEVKVARGTHPNLRSRLEEVDNKQQQNTTQLAQKRDKATLITTADIDKSSDANKLHLLDLSEEVQAAIAGTAPVIGTVVDGSLTSEKYAKGSVNIEKTSIIKDTTRNILEFKATNVSYTDPLAITGATFTNGRFSMTPTAPNDIYFEMQNMVVGATYTVWADLRGATITATAIANSSKTVIKTSPTVSGLVAFSFVPTTSTSYLKITVSGSGLISAVYGYAKKGVLADTQYQLNDDIAVSQTNAFDVVRRDYSVDNALICDFVKELYVPDATLKGNLTFTAFGKNSANPSWYIRLYAVIDGKLTKVYEHLDYKKTAGYTLVELVRVDKVDASAYAIVDWAAVAEGTLKNSMTQDKYILSEKAYDIKYSRNIQLSLESESLQVSRVLRNRNTTTALINDLVKEMYIPDESLKGNLTFTNFERNESTKKWYIRLFGTVGGVLTKVYEYTTAIYETNDLEGSKLIELERKDRPDESAFAVVDWNAIADGTFMSALTAYQYVLDDSVYDVRNAPTVRNYLVLENNRYHRINRFNNSVKYDEAIIGDLMSATVKLRRNYNVPLKGAVLSTDVFNYTKITDGMTKDEKLKALVPFVYVDGEKVGTFVLYDVDGSPYVYSADGTKLKLSYT